MNTMKKLGFTAAALFCLGLAQPASAAAGCPAIPGQGAEEIMSRAEPTAAGQDTSVTDAFFDDARGASAASTPAGATAKGDGPEEPALPCLPPLFCCVRLPLSDLVCCLTPIGNFCG
jgi:hypothetical protein